ncbi:MAG: hypothetical protein HW416_3118 [Chloroflexi bacterium]|nr:hypothetical protein [Chloroflexota bacterium]
MLRRGLEPLLRETLSSVPVVLLEGGRAVGKTTLCQQLLSDGVVQEIADLSDQGTLAAAQHDPSGFVSALRLPAVIDEAQLAESLTLAVKQRVDELGVPGLFILTGSVRLGQGALGGSDPLAGRVARLRLHSFTQGERNGTPVDVLPWLHKGEFPERRFGPIHDCLIHRILLGGLPTIPGVLTPGGSPSARRDRLEGYVESVLHTAIGETRSDRARVLDTFRAIVGTPGRILNLETMARDLRVSSPTLRGYIQLLESSFLLEEIPALANDARREIKGHARLIPSDVALAAWAGRQSLETLAANPTALGPLVHTLVLSELHAQAAWSERARVLHWRLRDDEVDAVLQFPDGVLVGIEVKAAKSIGRSDVAGLRSFLRRVRGARHGVVFYLGEHAFELEPNIWAVPVPALWDTSLVDVAPSTQFARPAPLPEDSGLRVMAPEDRGTDNTPSDAAVFVSYVHADDQAESGRIVRLGRDIAERYRLLTGEELETFIDRDLRWGDEWRARLKQQLARTTFFVPIITPRFLHSEACRGEVLTFGAAADSAGVSRFVLPILYIKPPAFDENDPVATVLSSHQWADWTATRYEEPGSGAYRREVDRLCQRLSDAVNQVAGRSTNTSGAAESSGDSDDLLARFERIESATERLPMLFDRFTQAVNDVSQALHVANPDTRAMQMPASMRQFRATLRRLADQLAPPTAALDQATSDLRAQLASVDTDLNAIFSAASSDESAARMLGGFLSSLRDGLPDGLGLERDQLDEIRGQMRVLGRAALELRGPMRSMEDAFLLMSDVETMLQRWRQGTGL